MTSFLILNLLSGVTHLGFLVLLSHLPSQFPLLPVAAAHVSWDPGSSSQGSFPIRASGLSRPKRPVLTLGLRFSVFRLTNTGVSYLSRESAGGIMAATGIVARRLPLECAPCLPSPWKLPLPSSWPGRGFGVGRGQQHEFPLSLREKFSWCLPYQGSCLLGRLDTLGQAKQKFESLRCISLAI